MYSDNHLQNKIKQNKTSQISELEADSQEKRAKQPKWNLRKNPKTVSFF